jgi:hypothetical protein
MYFIICSYNMFKIIEDTIIYIYDFFNFMAEEWPRVIHGQEI